MPKRLTVVGSGPVGCELAQAFSRLGAAVTLVGPTLLKGDEPEAGVTLGRVLEKEGVRHVLGSYYNPSPNPNPPAGVILLP